MTRTNAQRSAADELRWKAAGAIRPEMAWPGGPRWLRCL